MRIEEEFFSGFCRTFNMTNSVCCEYEADGDSKILVQMDCQSDTCIYHDSCTIYKEAKSLETTFEGNDL